MNRGKKPASLRVGKPKAIYFFHLPDLDLGPEIRNMFKRTCAGLRKGRRPQLSTHGAGGTYFLSDVTRKYVSVFKPHDEEPKAANNPRPRGPQGLSISSNGLKKGTKVGGGALREVAAYLLDHPKTGPREGFAGEVMGFAGVPPTMLVGCFYRFRHSKLISKKGRKMGSLQMFVENDGSCAKDNSRTGSSCSKMDDPDVPVMEVHKISVLDIRFANADRHAGNILFRRGENGDATKNVLIPIDHGYCFPENFAACTFVWCHWWQAKVPYKQEFIDYINSLNADEDIALLEKQNLIISRKFARTLRISTTLLQKGVKEGLTPFHIGDIMCRKQGPDQESIIEKIVGQAMDKVFLGLPEEEYEKELIRAVPQFMDFEINEYKKGIGSEL